MPDPTLFLIISNISKRANIRSLLLAAAAFGCPAVFVVKQRAFDFDPSGKDVPPEVRPVISSGAMKIVRFDHLNECVEHIRSLPGRNVRIVGVEIDERAVEVESEDAFQGDTALMMGNEGTGMSDKQMRVCDGFVRISQYGGGTASLNVSVAASLVMHRFDLWSRGIRVGSTNHP